jgi:predicted nucleic acid-binding protein
MVLVDTSVWVERLRRGLPELARLREAASVVCHPFVLGELACGNLKNRREIIDLLQPLCTCPVARHEEVLSFIEANRLIGGASRLHRHAPARLRPARRHLPVDSRPTPQDGCTRSEWDLGWSATDRMDGWTAARCRLLPTHSHAEAFPTSRQSRTAVPSRLIRPACVQVGDTTLNSPSLG